MLSILGFLKNPLFQLVAQKTVGAISHKIEKDKIVKAKELEAAAQVSVAQVNQQSKSIKDELLTIFIIAILACCFIPQTQPYMEVGFQMLKEKAPTEFWWAVLIVFSGSFGLSTLNNIRKK